MNGDEFMLIIKELVTPITQTFHTRILVVLLVKLAYD